MSDDAKPAFVIFYVDHITDPTALDPYQMAAHKTIDDHGGVVMIAYGRQEVVEGADPIGVVMLRFPSYAAAQGWYHSPEYGAAKKLREGIATCRTVIVEGR
jgi:uncharacterized protein (DUF1330 family)